MPIQDPAIPFGSTIVVVGANGYMALEVCDKVLMAGFRVRGTVRDVSSTAALQLNEVYQRLHGILDPKYPGMFELVEVADFEVDGAFDVAFKGASGVIFVSVPTIFNPDPSKVVDPLIRGLINSLEAAKAANVKRYVLNSSSKAVDSADYSRPARELTVDTFNHEAIEDMRNGDPTDVSFGRIVEVYSAARALHELAFWDWLETNDEVPFVANCLVPDGQFGRVMDMYNVEHGVSSNGQLKNVMEGNWAAIGLQLAYFSDVQDSARLIVAALTLKSVSNERIFSYNVSRSWNGMRHKVRELFPDRPELVQGEDQPVAGHDLATSPKPTARASQILQEIGHSGFVSEDAVIRDFVTSMFPQ